MSLTNADAKSREYEQTHQGVRMEVLIAVLLWLGVVEPNGTYSSVWIDETAQLHSGAIMSVVSDSVATSYLTETYGAAAASIDIVDVRGR